MHRSYPGKCPRTALVTSPVRVTLAFPGIYVHREGAEPVVKGLVDSLIVEDLAQLIADYRAL
jgi:hypothetical protein